MGRVAEWLKAAVPKTARAVLSWVRILPLPPKMEANMILGERGRGFLITMATVIGILLILWAVGALQ